jgi:paraquat-inducible protein B
MKTKVNPTLLGAFVVAGLGLVVTGLVVFGSGRLFEKPIPFVMVVQDSINGLREGAPVKFKGVPVGEVRRLVIGLNTNGQPANIQIYAEINPQRLMESTGADRTPGETLYLPELVMQGLRATLELESFVTGQLYISLDMKSNAKPPPRLLTEAECVEIPVETTGLKEFLRSIEEVNVAALAKKADDILGKVDNALKGLDLGRMQQKLEATLDGVNALVQAPGATNLVPTLNRTIEEAHRLIADLREQVSPLAGAATNSLDRLTVTVSRIEELANDLDSLIQPDSRLIMNFNESLRELSRAANSLRLFADSLRRTPQALITGRQFQKVTP